MTRPWPPTRTDGHRADADTLSAYGATPAHTLRADEALPWGAIAIGAAVVGGGEAVNPADGVAAVLRYPPTAST